MTPDDAPRPLLHDRVRVPGGRVGEVMGFYRRNDESVLVRFARGEPQEYPVLDVRARDLSIGADVNVTGSGGEP